MKRPEDSAETHRAKCEAKRRELEKRGFSDAQIAVFMRSWDRFDPRTHFRRMNVAKRLNK